MMLIPAIAYAPALRILVSPLNCPECAVLHVGRFLHATRQRPQGSSLVFLVCNKIKVALPEQLRETLRAGEATFFAPRPNTWNHVSPGTPPLGRAVS